MKAIFITGAAQGIGLAIARLFAEKGWLVGLYDINENLCKDHLRDPLLQRAVAGFCDVTDSDSVAAALAAFTDASGGKLDVLVNNAGTTKFVAHGDLDGLDEADFQNIYGVNVIGAFQMVRAARSALTASGRAAVVNVASIAGVKGVGSSIAYAASKGALITMTKSLARVLGPEIRVNAVCPGFIEGEWLSEGMGQAVYDQTRAYLRQKTPLQVTCTADTVAESILSFIDSHSVVTGQHLVLDGGHLLL